LPPCDASWIDIVDMWARSTLALDGVLHGLDGEEVEAPSMPRTILDMGSERLLIFQEKS
jgi:hypothetical protein